MQSADCTTKQSAYRKEKRIEMQFEKLDIVNLVVVIGLCIGLIMAIFYDKSELSTNIAVGLLGLPVSVPSCRNITATVCG